MQSTSAETQALLSAFQLPGLHPQIPIHSFVAHSTYDARELAKGLIAAKVIRPHDIPPTVITAEDVVMYGLQAWFDRRTATLKRVEFGIQMRLGRSAEEIFDELNMHGGRDRTYTGGAALLLVGGYQPSYRMDLAASALEKVWPGLFATAFDAVSRASYRTVQLRLPGELWEQVCFRYWDCDASEEPSDKDARTALQDRFGEEEHDVIEAYLPSALKPVFGGKFCANWFTRRRYFGRRKLATIASTSESPRARRVAKQTLRLNAAIAQAQRMSASLPDLCGVDATCTHPAANLVFKPKGLAFELIDDLVNDAWNAGDATELLGIAELPTSADDLKHYFEKLDAAFTVLMHMDKLITLITQPTEPHYDD